MLCSRHALATLTGLFLLPMVASAHFLWIVVEPKAGPQTVKVFFGEAAEPDDPDLLDRVAGAQVWLVGGRGEPQPLELKKGTDSLKASVPALASKSAVILRHPYGVISRGGETFLLKYYAKTFTSALPSAWQATKDTERLPLEIVPRSEGEKTSFTVWWKGQPVAGSTVTVVGPGIPEKLEGTTDDQGVWQCQLPTSGHFSIRARHVEATPGTYDGKDYQSVRHYSTLALHHLPARVAPISHSFPDLPQGTTSFGGAVIDDTLYVYGGNYGNAHEYDRDGQSGDLWQLNLQDPQAWERVTTDKKRQGVGMVAHRGQLYRIGGFEARNKEGDEQDLYSQPEFARFDAQKKVWEQLPPLPEGRSSHDAAMLGDTLYVVGGWNMQGASAGTTWHQTALALDLSKSPLQWHPIAAPPFQRRALALAAWQGKLYAIGGMEEKGGTTTAVAIYDPKTDSWSAGPTLLGSGMDGFGASAFALRDGLYVTTMSGSVQRLSAESQEWEYLGQLKHPRFFHRILPWQDQRLVIVGGAHMSVGKVPELELIQEAK